MHALILSGLFLVLLWLIHIFLEFSHFNRWELGIRPRETEGLIGILTAPLIHGDWGHLASNSIPVFVLGASILYFYPRLALRVWAGVWLLSGLWVWLAAGEFSSHAGASGLVYGFAAFLFFSGIFRREPGSIAIALAVTIMYGGLVVGVFPGKEGVSWQSHLFGGVAGTVIAYFGRNVDRRSQRRYSWEDEPEDAPQEGPWSYRGQFDPEEKKHLPGNREWD